MIFIAAYLSFHFLLYGLFLRELSAFKKEKIIFLYHAVSFAVGLLAAGALVILGLIPLHMAVAAICLHGIYSLSFLELWALSDGGYSLRILDWIERSGPSVEFRSLISLGGSKKKSRLESLKRLGLIALRPQGWMLTPRGRAVTALLYFFVCLSRQNRVSG